MKTITYNLQNNIYYNSNKEYFSQLLKIVLDNPIGYKNIILKLHSKKYKKSFIELKEWIFNSTKFLDKTYTFATRCYWILNGYLFFPFCVICKKPILRNVRSIKDGYVNLKYNLDEIHCSNKCAQKNIVVQTKIKNTWQKTLGVDNPSKLQKIKDKKCQTMLKHYNVKYVFQSKKLMNKCKKTMFKNTGSTYPLGNLASKEKFKATCLKKFGVENPMFCPKIRAKGIHKYKMNNNIFDSKDELIFYIWLNDNNIKCICQPNKTFSYKYDSKIYHYHPDFIVNGLFIEIKGLLFFKDKDPTKRMISPYHTTKNSKKTKLWYDDKNEAKHKCMIKNNVKIITVKSLEYIKAYNYFISKYSMNYLLQFRLK